jgi:hypothetical protein
MRKPNLVAAICLSVAAICFSAPSHAQSLTIQIRDSGGTILGTFPSGTLILKCDTTLTCVVSGTTVLLTPTAGGGTGGNTIVVNSTAATAPIVNFNTTTPAAPSGSLNAIWQHDSNTSTMSASAYLPPFVAAGAGHAPGLVPDPGGTGGLTRYLGDDGSWHTFSIIAFYQTIQQAGSSQTQRHKLNFLAPVTLADNSGNDSTDVTIPAFLAGSTHNAGLVADPGATLDTTKFLRMDNTFATPSGSAAYATVEHNGSAVTQRATVNFIDGANVTLTVADNSGASRTDITVAAAGGGGGAGDFSTLKRQSHCLAGAATGAVQGNLAGWVCLGEQITQSSGGVNNTIMSPGSTYHNGAGWEGSSSPVLQGSAFYRTGQNLQFAARAYQWSTSSQRQWIALTAASATSIAATDDPTTTFVGLVGFRYSDGAGDTAWMAVSCDGTPACTYSSTGVAADAIEHRFAIIMDDTTPNIKYYIDGTLVATITTHLIGNGHNIAVVLTSLQNMGLAGFDVQSDF